jgi:hypothetical protein
VKNAYAELYGNSDKVCTMLVIDMFFFCWLVEDVHLSFFFDFWLDFFEDFRGIIYGYFDCFNGDFSSKFIGFSNFLFDGF